MVHPAATTYVNAAARAKGSAAAVLTFQGSGSFHSNGTFYMYAEHVLQTDGLNAELHGRSSCIVDGSSSCRAIMWHPRPVGPYGYGDCRL